MKRGTAFHYYLKKISLNINPKKNIMDKLTTIKKGGKTLVSVRAYQGDAMTLLAMSIDESITKTLQVLV
jgi:hypothetical protein